MPPAITGSEGEPVGLVLLVAVPARGLRRLATPYQDAARRVGVSGTRAVPAQPIREQAGDMAVPGDNRPGEPAAHSITG